MRGREIDLGLFVLRLSVGGILLYYGCQKMFGLFAGSGFTHQIQGFEKMGFPPLLGTLSIFAEFFGALGLITGTLTRVAAFGVMANMAVATWVTMKQPDLFKNIFTYGQATDARMLAFPLLLSLCAFTIVLTGAGRFSIDAKLFGKRAPKKG